MSWLGKLFRQYNAPVDFFARSKELLRKHRDPRELCEALLETFEPPLGSAAAEGFVRQILVGLERHGQQSLEADDVTFVVDGTPASSPALRKRLNAAAPEFTPSSSPVPRRAEDVEPPADAADEEYLDYEEEHGYSTLSPEEILQSVFMDLPVEEIRDSLIANGWNVERTLETLLTPEVPHIQLDANYDRPTQTSTAISTQNVRPVCRHFLGGNCYRSDCWYSHDPEGLVCRYWLSGGCMKGTACPFTHGSDLLGRTTETAQRSHPSIPQPARPPAEDFPALSASKGPARAKLDFWGPTQKFVDVARKKPAKGSLPPSVSNTNAPSALVPLKRSTTLVQAKWVSTGDTLAATYTQFRQEAIDAAIQRNKLFQRATQAYLSGNKAAAKAFSLGAHRMNERVEELHRQAGKRIYATRNASHTVNGNGDVQVDLHGLHPSEAVEMLESKIANLKRQNFSGRLIVVTGTGNHSRGQKAKLLPAIREYLQQKGLRAQESSMSDRRGGAFTINI